MKKILLLLAFFFSVSIVFAQKKKSGTAYKGDAEVGCGQCQFKMTETKGCDMAVRIGDKNYFVENKKIDDYGDAHAADGFCNAIHHAYVEGTIKKNKFIATKIELKHKH